MSTVQNHRPSPAPRRQHELSRAELFEIIAGCVRAGISAPARIEFTELPSAGLPSDRQVEIEMPEGDAEGVRRFASLFHLPAPTAAGWTTTRGLEKRRCYGSSSIRMQLAVDELEPRLHHGWAVSVHTLIPETPPQQNRTVGTARMPLINLPVAPRTTQVIS